MSEEGNTLEIEEIEELIDYQDIHVTNCIYCPFNYEKEECIAGKGKSLIKAPRDEKNFPLWCPLKHKAMLVRM